MKQKIKRLTALVCAVAMMAALCLALRPVDTAYGASLNDQLAETRAKKQEIQQQLDQIKSDKAKALEQKELLDQQAAVIAQQIDLLELQIKDTQDRITENEAQEEQQYQLFCRQVREEEERGTVSTGPCCSRPPALPTSSAAWTSSTRSWSTIRASSTSCAPCASSWLRIRRTWSSSRRSLPPARQSWTPRWPRLSTPC